MCLTQSGIEGAQMSCFEFKFAQYTTAAIHSIALDLASIYYVNAGHGTFRIFEFESVLTMYTSWSYSNQHHLL